MGLGASLFKNRRQAPTLCTSYITTRFRKAVNKSVNVGTVVQKRGDKSCKYVAVYADTSSRAEQKRAVKITKSMDVMLVRKR